MTTTRSGSDVDVDRCVRQIAAGLHPRLDQLGANIQRYLEQEIPDLGGDALTTGLLGPSITGNVDTMLHAMRFGIDVRRVEAPTAALEYARRLAQHGVPVHALVRAYRVGQRRLYELVFAEVQATDMDPKVGMAVLDRMSATMFAYIDWISQHVVEVYEGERERWLENQNSLRAVRVREILASRTDIDVDAATSVIRYPLRWHHLAVVIWYPEAGAERDELARLQRFLRELGQAVGAAANPLFVAENRMLGWGWIPFRAAPPEVIEKARRFASSGGDAPSVGIGTVTAGVGGFRRSHRRALAARSLAVARDEPGRAVIAATDPGVSAAALLAGDLDEARDWVAEVLGDLAGDNDSDARLRETLHVFLASGDSYKQTGEQLLLHANTVKYRVGRALGRRGRAIGADRLDVELALLLCHWYGTAVAQPQPA
ncbi:MAG TPA: helix-turn-helix domain-containing protein [Mycobacterium sp.]|nr:helix-turn-helix domain-containing protein [Mycobacterium sp.]